MVFPQRGEENLLRRTSSCKNFQPNMFNKHKCQNCFRTREAHDLDSDAANKKPKKVILCGFLFVAPGLDPENPASRNRKWQRRFFVLYETGELNYQLDDNPSTAPQGTVNMYTCTQVYNAKNSIGHDHSMGIVTPDGTLFVKAETREEKDSWFPVLSEYPRINQEEENYKKKRKKKEEREKAASSSIPVIDSSKEVTTTTAIPESKSGEKPNSGSGVTIRRESSFKENIQPPKKADSKSQTRPASLFEPTRSSHLKDSDQFNFRRSRSLREKRHSSQAVEEEDDLIETKEEKEKDKSKMAPSLRKSHATYDRPLRRHTSPVKQVDFPMPDVSKLKGERKPSNVREDTSDEDSDSKEEEQTSKDISSSDYMETLHRNNNNVYKPDHIENVSQIPKRKNSLTDSVSSRSSQNSGLPDGTKKTASSSLSKPSDPTDSAVLTDEELARLDVPKIRNMKISRVHCEPETHSPSKRTIEKRRHAKERRGRHTMDGSIQLIPVLDSDKEIAERKNSQATLKRSNSDPNLADTEDDQQRKAIAEIFPGLYHLKNGWLNLMGKTDKEWSKYWFVLKDNKLSFYNDSKDDVSNMVGSFDLAGSEEAVDFPVDRNYGFKVKMITGENIIFSAMTSAIRTKWVSALNKAILTAHSEGENSPVIEDALLTQFIGETEKLPDKPVVENVTQVDSNRIEVEETSEEPKKRAPSQRIRDRRSRRSSRGEESKRDSMLRLSSESDVFFDALPNFERKQPEGRSESPDKGIADHQSGEINEVLEEAVDALKARVKVVEDENAALRTKNIQLLGGLDILRKHQIPLENTSEVEFVNQIEKLVKHRSKLEHEMEEQKIQLKQMRNATDLTDQKNQELQEQVASLKEELSKKQGDYDNLQSRFEKLVMDLKEMETERSTTRTKIKEERDKTLDMIDRLNKRIDILERENSELREDVKQAVAEVEREKEKCSELESRLAEGNELVVVECEAPVEKSAAGLESSSSSSAILEEELEKAQREKTSLLAQLQGANRTTTILREKLKEKEELVSLNSSSQDLEDMRKEVRDKEDELEALSERLKTEEEKFSILQVKYDQLAEEVSGRSQRMKNLEGQLRRESEMRLNAEKDVSEMEAERTNLKDKISLCQSEIEKLQMSNAAMEEDKTAQLQKFTSLKNSLELVTSEKDRLEEDRSKNIEEAEKSRKEINAKEEVLKMLQEEIKRVKSEGSKQRHEVDRLQKENEDLYSRLDSANRESEAWQDKAEALMQRQEEMTSQAGYASSQEEVAQLREELVRERTSSDAALKNLELEIESKEEELQTVSIQAEDYQKQLQLLSDALKDKAEMVLRLEAEVAAKDQSLSNTNEQLLGKSDRLEKEVKRLRSQLADSQKAYDALEIQHMQVKDQQTQVESTYKTEMELMGRRIQDLTAKLSTAEKKVLASGKDSKGSKHKNCKIREAEAASRIEDLERQVQQLQKKLKITTHKLLDVTTKELELRKLHQAKCIETSRLKEQNRSSQRELILIGKKSQNVDEILKEHEKMHQQSLEEVKQTYSEKLRSMEDTRRKEQRCDSEALSTALEAVKRVYDEQLQQERRLLKAGTAKDVDSMMRRHTDVVTHMNKDWVIMSSKFSELCRENAQLTSTITNLQKTLAETKESMDSIQKTNQAKIDEIVNSISDLKTKQSPPEVELRVEEEGDEDEPENEKMRMLNITLKLRELELKCAQDELKALRNLKESASDVPSELQEPDGAVGGEVGEQYLHSGLKVSSL